MESVHIRQQERTWKEKAMNDRLLQIHCPYCNRDIETYDYDEAIRELILKEVGEWLEKELEDAPTSCRLCMRNIAEALKRGEMPK
jgi:transcription initiation factor IIE alpha subunit